MRKSASFFRKMDKAYRIGVYGGTFSPPHAGHVAAARAFISELKLDRLYISVAGIPPHKKLDAGDAPDIRSAMAKAAFSVLPEAVVSDYEIKKGGVSYTADTLSHFKSELSHEFDSFVLYFLCGTDMFLSLDTWRRPEVIFDCATIACARRESDAVLTEEIARKKSEYEQHYRANIILLSAPAVEISSSEIRERLTRGDDVTEYIDEHVAELIKKNNLYFQMAD